MKTEDYENLLRKNNPKRRTFRCIRKPDIKAGDLVTFIGEPPISFWKPGFMEMEKIHSHDFAIAIGFFEEDQEVQYETATYKNVRVLLGEKMYLIPENELCHIILKEEE